MRYLTLLLLGIAGTATSQAQISLRETQSICELFKDLGSHAGKIVTVRGLLYQSMEIFALGGRCESKFITKYSPFPILPGIVEIISEYVWPPAINLVGHASGGENLILYETDVESVTSAVAFIAQERIRLQNLERARKNNASGLDAYVTVSGMLRMRSHYDIGPSPDGTIRGGGYGHLGIYPAELVIKVMGDPAVELRKPTEVR